MFLKYVYFPPHPKLRLVFFTVETPSINKQAAGIADPLTEFLRVFNCISDWDLEKNFP